jgi:hypothetical protein
MKTDHYRTQRRARAGGRNAPPCCCACGGELTFIQPDEKEPAALLGVCEDPACREWTLWARAGGRMITMSRIPRTARNPAWKPARPTSPATAGR